ncbi:MAG: hypothetical protein KUG68_12195, partial [Flavobacteriaceae bacterium]|nr:hypothetical protein [Flavobacteriaceae bacterium]
EYLNNKTNNDIILSKEESLNGIFITKYFVENKFKIEEQLKESYSFVYEPEIVGKNIHLNPFFFQSNSLKNPFKEEKRVFPIEYGHSSSGTYLLKINLNNKYEVLQIPKSKTINLPEKIGSCTITYSNSPEVINIRFNYSLNKYSLKADYYETLKEFFDKVVEFQTKDIIVLKKNSTN